MKIDSKFNCSINILSKKHRVLVEKNIEELGENAAGAIGLYYFSDHSIHLQEGLKLDIAEETLFHEMIHAIETDLYLGFSEKKVSAFSAVLYDTLKRNNLLNPLFENLPLLTTDDIEESDLSDEAKIELAKTGFSLNDVKEST